MYTTDILPVTAMSSARVAAVVGPGAASTALTALELIANKGGTAALLAVEGADARCERGGGSGKRWAAAAAAEREAAVSASRNIKRLIIEAQHSGSSMTRLARLGGASRKAFEKMGAFKLGAAWLARVLRWMRRF